MQFKVIVIFKSHSKTVLRTNEVFIWMQFYWYEHQDPQSFFLLEKSQTNPKQHGFVYKSPGFSFVSFSKQFGLRFDEHNVIWWSDYS